MRAFNFAGFSADKLKRLFETLCIAQYDALERGEIAAFNRRYDEIEAIQNELKSRPGDQRRILMGLFGHSNMQVRLTAARANLAVDHLAARRELQAIVDSKWYPQAMDAGMTLHHLDAGIYRPS